jgi:hypothetical protein
MRLKTIPSFFVLGILILAGAAPALAVSPELDSFSGRSYGELTAAWWQWVYSFPAAQSPQIQQGAVDCGVSQSGPIWFLAGSATGTDVYVRSCTVPHQKALFFPVLNSSWVNEPGETVTVAEKRDILDGVISDLRPGIFADFGLPGSRACRLEVKLDGEISTYTYPTVRVQSPPFAASKVAGHVDPESISDGFWVLLPPLSQGQHVLHIGGAFCEFDSTEIHPFIGGIDITYNLTVN